MTEALNRFTLEGGFSSNHNQSEPEEFTKAEILEYLAFSTFKEGMKSLNKYLYSLENKDYYRFILMKIYNYRRR